MWNMNRGFAASDLPRLTGDEREELFNLYNQANLAPTTMPNMEMVDGYLAALVAGPEPMPVHLWLEEIFGQPDLPICADAPTQERLLTLLLRHHNDISDSLHTDTPNITMENVYLPMVADVDDADCIRPYQVDENGMRLGRWALKDWATGFQRAMANDIDLWDALFDDEEYRHLISPILVAHMGYNPDKLDFQYDDATDLQTLLAVLPHNIYKFWRDYKRKQIVHLRNGDNQTMLQTPYLRDGAKIGRNEPCVCGSGKKYKKCCGA